MKKIYVAGGCFWGIQAYFDNIKGVQKTTVGYANSNIPNPTYEEVCSHKSNASETIEIFYDEHVRSLSSLLDLYYDVIDPVSKNKQGNDIGIQYRTGIYYEDGEDEAIIQASLQQLQTKYDTPLQIEVMPLENYYEAESYHQDYLKKNPNGYCHISKQTIEEAKEK